MSTETTPPVPHRNIFRKLGIAGAIGFVVMVVGYLFFTSGTFVKSFVLPKVAEALNAEVKVDEVSVGVFSGASLKGLLVRSDDTSLVTAKSASMKYSFWNLLSGRIRVSEFKLDAPEVYVVQRADGSSNLDPIVEGMQTQEQVEKESGKLDVLISNIDLNNARFRFEQTGQDGIRKVMEAADVKITVDQFGSGIEGTLKMSTRLNYESGTLAEPPSDSAEAVVMSEYKFSFDADLMPTKLNGNGNFTVTKATGALARATNLSADLGVALDDRAITDLSLQFKQGEATLGSVGITGEYDLEAQNAKLDIAVTDIGSTVLNLGGAMFGIVFGDTTVSTKIGLEVSNQFQDVNIATDVNVGGLAVTMGSLATPPIDLKLGCKAEISAAKQTLLLNQLQLRGLQGGSVFLETDMKQPFSVNWGEGGDATIPDATLGLKLINFNVAPWSGLSGGLVRAGLVNVDAVITNSAGGKRIGLGLTEQIRNLEIVQGTNVISGISADTALKLAVADLKEVSLNLLNVEARHLNTPLLTYVAGGTANIDDLSANIGMSANVNIPGLLQVNPIPDIALSSGALMFAGRAISSAQDGKANYGFNGQMTVTNLSGSAVGFAIDRFATDVGLQANLLNNEELKLEQLSIPMWLAGVPAGELGVVAATKLDGSAGTAIITVTNLNQQLMGLVLNGQNGSPSVRSARLDSALNAGWNGDAKSVQGQVALANLVLVDSQGLIPQQAISLMSGFDAKITGTTNISAIDVPLLKGALMLNGKDAGGFDLSAKYDAQGKTGSFKMAAGGINQNLLAPFAGGALGDKQLQSVDINVRAQGDFDLNKASEFNADLAVTNLVILDPTGKLPNTPLAVGLSADGAMEKTLLTLKSSGLRLAPTDRAKNEVNLSGTVDFGDLEAMKVNLLLAAESLDVTPYLDLMPASSEQPATTAAQPAATIPVDSNQEPAPFSLPFQTSKIETRIGQLYVREIEVTNAQIVTLLDRQSVNISPLTMAVNGGKVDGDVSLNTAVPGMRYDVNLDIDHVPVRPALISFSPAIGQTARGEIVSAVHIAGAGQTGRNLKQTLKGSAALYLTNAMIKLTPDPQPGAQPQTATFKAKAVQVLVTSLKGIAAILGIPDLTQSAITDVAAVVQMGDGLIKLQQANVKSSKFIVNAAGTIPIHDVITNSPLDIPVDVWLERTVASRLTLGSGTEPFAKLPQFVTIKGTVGAPAEEFDKAALAHLTLGAAAGIAKGLGLDIGDKAQNMLKGAASDGGGLLKGLGGLLGGQRQQAPPANTKTNAAPKGKNPFELFNLIPKN